MSSAKRRPFCAGLNVLKWSSSKSCLNMQRVYKRIRLQPLYRIFVGFSYFHAIIYICLHRKWIGEYVSTILNNLFHSWSEMVKNLEISYVVGKVVVSYAIIGSNYGMSPVQRQAPMLINHDLLSIEPLGTNFSEMWKKIKCNSFHSRNGFESSDHFISAAEC